MKLSTVYTIEENWHADLWAPYLLRDDHCVVYYYRDLALKALARARKTHRFPVRLTTFYRKEE